MLKTLAILLLTVCTTSAQNYLIFSDEQSARNRSMAQCKAMGCDGIGTVYWWAVIPLKDGRWAIELQANSAFGVAPSNKVTKGEVLPQKWSGPDLKTATPPSGLTTDETAKLQGAATVAPPLPNPEGN